MWRRICPWFSGHTSFPECPLETRQVGTHAPELSSTGFLRPLVGRPGSLRSANKFGDGGAAAARRDLGTLPERSLFSVFAHVFPHLLGCSCFCLVVGQRSSPTPCLGSTPLRSCRSPRTTCHGHRTRVGAKQVDKYRQLHTQIFLHICKKNHVYIYMYVHVHTQLQVYRQTKAICRRLTVVSCAM